MKNDISKPLQYPSDSETYREAAAWLDANTNYRLSPEFIRELNDIYKQTKRGNPITGYILTMSRGKYDKNGIIDGTRFNSTQVENIKKHEEQMLLAAKNRIAEMNVLNGVILLIMKTNMLKLIN